MRLEGEKWQNYSTPFVDNIKKDNKENGTEIPSYGHLQTFSLGELRDNIDRMIKNVELNKKDIYETPVFIKFDNDLYVFDNAATSIDKCSLGANKCDKLVYTAPDSKPENGEYWSSRGPSSFDCSGFIKSKLAGERLLRMVKYILDTGEPESWLDYRDFEPNWIQFKFSAKEFNVKLLDELSRDTGKIVTEEILRKCKL